LDESKDSAWEKAEEALEIAHNFTEEGLQIEEPNYLRDQNTKMISR